MGWANSCKVDRATSTQISENIWLVHWWGADYSIQRKGSDWWIRSRTTGGNVIHVLTEKEGLGKEEAIAWIEDNM